MGAAMNISEQDNEVAVTINSAIALVEAHLAMSAAMQGAAVECVPKGALLDAIEAMKNAREHARSMRLS